MLKAIVYESSTGHTKQYAEMLGEKIKVPALTAKEARKHLKRNDEIIFLVWIAATKIKGLAKVKKYNVKCVGAVGIYPKEDAYIASLATKNKLDKPLFYLRGGLNYDKLGYFTKKLFMWVGKMMEIDNKPENQEMIKLFKYGANFVSESNLQQIIDYVRA